MSRNQHIYHFLHHDIYLPLPSSVAPYSTQIVRSLTLCPDSVPTFKDLDALCTFNNTFPDICKLITVDGYWSPEDPISGKCTWKNGTPDNTSNWGIPESAVHKKEPFVIAILPHPKTYLWRHWLIENSLRSNITNEFSLWASQQPSSFMLNALVPISTNQLDVDTRITRVINAMRSGQALLTTEIFTAQLYRTEGKQGLERWISAHLGYFLTIKELKINWQLEPVIDLDPKLFAEDERFYYAVQQENDRWTKDWNNWRETFLPLNSGRVLLARFSQRVFSFSFIYLFLLWI
jgi:hypothetical protein